MPSDKSVRYDINNFMAGMASELRTPLNTMIGFANVLLKGIDGPINEQQKSDLTILVEAGQDTIALLNIMLEVIKIDADYLKIYSEEVNLNQIIDDVISTWPDSKFIPSKFIGFEEFAFKLETSENLPNIWADKLRISQILHFLLAETARSHQEAALITSYDDRQVIISITTHDPITACPDFIQMPPLKIYENIYEHISDGPFVFYEAISRSLIELHGGELRKMKNGDDFTLSFTLPIDKNRPSTELVEGSVT